MPDFESNARREQARIRHDDDVSDTQVAGYRNTDDGSPAPNLGNEDGPYVNVVGRASTDPLAADPGVPAVETGKGQRILTDAYGRVITINAPSLGLVETTTLVPAVGAPVAAVLGVAGAALLYEASAADLRTAPATTLYLQVFDSVAAPAAAAAPVLSFGISGFSDIDFTTEAGPMVFLLGCWVAISSTPVAYTAISSELFTLMLRVGA